MCMEDVRIGRETVPAEWQKAITDTGAIIVSQNDLRYSLVIANIGANPIWLSFTKPTASGTGIPLAVGATFGPLDVQHHGNLITRDIWAITAAGLTASVLVWETLLGRK